MINHDVVKPTCRGSAYGLEAISSFLIHNVDFHPNPICFQPRPPAKPISRPTKSLDKLQEEMAKMNALKTPPESSIGQFLP